MNITRMEFSGIKDVSGLGGTTTIGTCKINGTNTPCVEKILESEDFEKFVNVNKVFRVVLEKYGPHVYHIDTKNHKVYMEYIQCVTIDEYCRNLNINVNVDLQKLKKILESIKECLSFMKDNNACHNDMHSENLLVCGDGSVKMIDIESITGIEDGCSDEYEIYAGIKNIFLSKLPFRAEYASENTKMKEKYRELHIKGTEEINRILRDVSPGEYKCLFRFTEREKKYMFF